ncbi:conjugal transfer pilus assembly protein TraK [Gammaproteobacteria bacterium]
MLIETSKISFRTVAFAVSMLLGALFAADIAFAEKYVKNIKVVETTKSIDSAENIIGDVGIYSENKKADSSKSNASIVKDIKNVKNTADSNSESLKDISISGIPLSVENKMHKASEINKTNETDKANVTNEAAHKEVSKINRGNNTNSNTSSIKTNTNKAVISAINVIGNDQITTETAEKLSANENRDTAKDIDTQLVNNPASNEAAGKKVAKNIKSITSDGVENAAKAQKVQKIQDTKKIKAAEVVSKNITISGTKEISFADNEQLTVFLSNRDINRILVQGDKIQSINGPTGLYTAKNDTSGSAYISLYGDTTFTIFISTVKGHNFSLLVNPKSVAGKTIILIPTTPSSFVANFGETESYQRILVTLISSMINNEALEDYSYSKKSEVKKFKKTDFYGIADVKPIAFYNGSHLAGIVSEIRNKSRKPITLKPSYFYKSGVRAITLSSQTLAPTETCLLYQVVSRY